MPGDHTPEATDTGEADTTDDADDATEAADDAARAISRQESLESLVLWAGVLGSPAAWFGHLGLNYSLEEWFACSPSATDPGEILGFGVDAVSLALNSLMALAALTSGLLALTCWHKLRPVTNGDTVERARWMAFAGTVEGAVFLPMILLGYLPPLLLDTCVTTP